MSGQYNRGLRVVAASAIALLFSVKLSLAADCAPSRLSPKIHVQLPQEARIRAGEPVEIRWSSVSHRDKDCRSPLYLVFTTAAHVRFEGDGFLAMPGGAAAPYGISEKQDRTRVFIPLHALPESASGSFKVKFFSAGANAMDWFVAGLSSNFEDEQLRSSAVLAVSQENLRIAVESGKPAIVVRDSFAPDISTAGANIEHPKKTIISNSNEFELQVFEKFYRVFDVRTGDLVLERAGANPNFSPSSRFLGSFADGVGFEIVDLYADTTIVTSGALNRRGGYEGTAHVAAWSRGDATVALSFWGWGGVYVQQTLVDGTGIGDGAPSCHACRGIGIALWVNNETGIISWTGQQKGWGSFFDPTLSSSRAKAQAAKEFPDSGDDNTTFERQQALEQKLSLQYLTDLGTKYLFDGKALFDSIPPESDVWQTDGSAWHIGDRLRLSHTCTPDAEDNCASKDSEEDRAKQETLVSHRIDHNGLSNDGPPQVQLADARLMSARARSSRRIANRTRNIWTRLAQLKAPIISARTVDVKVETFNFDTVFKNPSIVMNKLSVKIPSIRQIMVPKFDSLDVPDFVDDDHETKKIDPKKVTKAANWKIGELEYWLIHENYQSGNSSTPNTQYLHLVSGNASGISSIIDLSTRLSVSGTLAKGTDQEDLGAHPWPSDFDLVTIASERFLLASGHWLHDSERWGLVYDLKEDKTLFFNGNLPSATTTKSLALTANGKIFAVANSNGYVYFYSIATGKQVLTANDIDDELVIYDPNGYYISTYEGSQFVFLKFPGLAGYLSFKQFAKSLRRPDIIRAIFDGAEAPAEPDLLPPPHLTLTARAENGKPGILHLSASLTSRSRDLVKLRLFLDGQPWTERTISGRTVQIDESIVVPEQTRWLTAVAVDVSGSESVPVAASIPRDNRPSNRKLFVFAIGTNTYAKSPRDLQLHYAVSDAKSFASAVQAQNSGYYKTVEATRFLDSSDLKTKLPQELKSAAQSATRDDTVMLFVSGHGYRAPNNKLYLIVRETIPNNIEETSLSWEELARAFDGTKARIIVFIDACHSGAIPDGGSNDEIVDALTAQQVRFTVIAAAKGRQESFERKELGGGVFTTAIVSAITSNRAAIDSNNNGVIELSELYGAIKPSVLSEMNGRQTPWLARTDMVGEVPLF